MSLNFAGGVQAPPPPRSAHDCGVVYLRVTLEERLRKNKFTITKFQHYII